MQILKSGWVFLDPSSGVSQTLELQCSNMEEVDWLSDYCSAASTIFLVWSNVKLRNKQKEIVPLKNKKLSSCWKTSYSWIKKDMNSECACCSVCKRSFHTDNSGLSSVKAHTSSTGHNCKINESYKQEG